MITWFKYGIFKTDYNSMQLTLTSIVQLLATLVGILLAIIIFIIPQITESRSKLKYYKPPVSNYLLYGKQEPCNANDRGNLIEEARLQILNWINADIYKDSKQDLLEMLEATSLLCIYLTDDIRYHEKVRLEFIGDKDIKRDDFINEMDFFNLIEKLYTAYWFRHLEIPNIPLFQTFFKEYTSTGFFHNNFKATFINYMTGKKLSLIILLSSSLVIASLILQSLITMDNFISGLHIINICCGVILFLAILDIAMIVGYILKMNRFMRNSI